MPAAKQHYAYADALINAAIKEFIKNGRSAKKSAVIRATKGPEKASFNASYAADKKMRPKNPSSNWNATAAVINRNIQNAAWKTTRTAYRKVSREKTDLLPLPGNNGRSYATILAIGAAKKGRAGHAISRRGLLALGGLATVSVLVLGTGDARAENWGYVNDVKGDINAYVAGKRSAIEAALRAGLR